MLQTAHDYLHIVDLIVCGGLCVWSLCWYAVPSVLFSFFKHLTEEMRAGLCTLIVLCLLLRTSWVCLQCVLVPFHGHTHLFMRGKQYVFLQQQKHHLRTKGDKATNEFRLIFILGSAVVKTLNFFSSRGGFLTYPMHHHMETSNQCHTVMKQFTVSQN